MNLNSILKTGGKVDVLIRTKASQVINDALLVENEPYTLIEKININFETSQEGASSYVNGRVLSYNDNTPNRIILYNVPLTEKICHLIFQSRQKLNKTYQCILESNQHTLILHHQNVYNVFIFNLNNQKIGEVNVVNDGKITSNLFQDQEKYLVFYEYEISQKNNNIKMYNLESPERSYFTLDIFAKGNQDNISSDVFLKIDTCALVTNNHLSFNTGLNDVNLIFDIIKINKDKNKNYLIIE